MKRSLVAVAAVVAAALASRADKPLNVLYILVDDLRPQIGPYNITDPAHVLTPNLDKLASESVVFRRSYCNQAVCSPSRNSFLWGRRPKNTKIWNFISSTRQNFPEFKTMPQYFKEDLGYLTTGMGKSFHPGHPKNDDQPYSWTRPQDGGWEYFDPNHQITICDSTYGGHPISCVIPDNETVDYVLAETAVGRLQELKRRSEPFFMTLGHLKPHPFVAVPQSAFDKYPLESIPLPKYPTYIANRRSDPEPSFYSCTSVNHRTPLLDANLTISPYDPLPDNITRTIRQAYFAGTTHTDEQIGKTLAELERLGMMDSTVIVFHADHGWGLGESAEFCKMGDSEHRTGVPFMVRYPSGKHAVVEDPVELVSVMNTVIELATGKPVPDGVSDGVSYASSVTQPGSSPTPPRGFDVPLAFSVYPRCFNSPSPVQNPCIEVHNSDFSHMGLTVRSRDFRYTEWRLWDGKTCTPRFDVPPAEVLLFDHTHDGRTSFDGDFEQTDRSADPNYAATVKQHAAWVAQQWHAGWESTGCGKDAELTFTGTGEGDVF